MKLFELYVANIQAARDVFQLQYVVREACRSAAALPMPIDGLANPETYAIEARKNLALLQQLLELADKKLKEFEEEQGEQGK
jgi:hypothetical protein